jgi:hypothetical protein
MAVPASNLNRASRRGTSRTPCPSSARYCVSCRSFKESTCQRCSTLVGGRAQPAILACPEVAHRQRRRLRGRHPVRRLRHQRWPLIARHSRPRDRHHRHISIVRSTVRRSGSGVPACLANSAERRRRSCRSVAKSSGMNAPSSLVWLNDATRAKTRLALGPPLLGNPPPAAVAPFCSKFDATPRTPAIRLNIITALHVVASTNIISFWCSGFLF